MTWILLWLILLLLSWPIALGALVILPLLWLLVLPFRILAAAVNAALHFIGAIFMLPARLLRRIA